MNQNKNKCNAIKKLKLGVIGEGMIGLIHIKTLDRMKECELIGISYPDISKKELTEKIKVKYYSDYKKMINHENPDGVVISVPNKLHK